MNTQLFNTKTILSMLILVSMMSSVQAKGWNQQKKSKGGVWMTELNLNTKQMEKIKALRDEMQPAIMSVRHQNRTMELELKQLSRGKTSDRQRITELKKAIDGNQQAIAALQQNHRAEVRTLLTVEQQEAYDRYGSRSFSNTRRGNGRDMNTRSMDGPRAGRGKQG
jgi:Spy/CpxP family protein refolding chaperone